MRNAIKAVDGTNAICAEDHEQLSVRAADIIASTVAAEPELLFCVAAGATPIRTYRRLADSRHRLGGGCSIVCG